MRPKLILFYELYNEKIVILVRLEMNEIKSIGIGKLEKKKEHSNYYF